MTPPVLPATEGAGAYTPLPEGSTRRCSHCGAPARYVHTPTTLDEATADNRERLCERCHGIAQGSEATRSWTTPISGTPVRRGLLNLSRQST